jgi:16S rRNA C1402 (ribose-2'-O) methylase RsmI
MRRAVDILGACALLALLFAGGMVAGTMLYVGYAIYSAAH